MAEIKNFRRSNLINFKMKSFRTIFLALIGIFIMNLVCNCSSGPVPTTSAPDQIIGYDEVSWGATIDEVKQFYPNVGLPYYVEKADGEKLLKYYEEKADGIKIFREFVKNNVISERTFYFYQDKLYQVVVVYYESVKDDVIKKLISLYGNPKEKEKYEKELHFYTKYWNVCNNLTIETLYSLYSFNVSYYDPTVAKQIQDIEEKRESERINNIKL